MLDKIFNKITEYFPFLAILTMLVFLGSLIYRHPKANVNFIAVQYRNNGSVLNCWKLKNYEVHESNNSLKLVSLSDKTLTISNTYVLLSIQNEEFEQGMKTLNLESCKDGIE